MAEELTSTIRDNAGSPKSATGDGQSVTQHSLADQIAADKYLRAQSATRSRKLPIRVAKVNPGGAV